MNSLTIFTLTTFYTLAVSYAGLLKRDNKLYNEEDVIYTGQHDIVKIYASLPLMEELNHRVIFFIEADINNDGSKYYKGLYVMHENSTSKLLDNGRDIAGNSGKVYFATTDGVYKYNNKEMKAFKYGNVDQSIISIDTTDKGAVYALTESQVLYKITENGKTSEVDDRVKGARGIVLDCSENIYYYDNDKVFYAVVNQDVKKVEGLPKNITSLQMYKPPPIIEGVFLLLDDVPYLVHPNATSTKSEADSKENRATASSFDGVVVYYFARDKKIYEYNLLARALTGILDSLSSWVKKNFGSFLFSN